LAGLGRRFGWTGQAGWLDWTGGLAGLDRRVGWTGQAVWLDWTGGLAGLDRRFGWTGQLALLLAVTTSDCCFDHK